MTDPVPSKDLVARLRDPYEADGYGEDMVVRREAAAEIERLQRQVDELSIHAEKWVKRALGGTAPEPAVRGDDLWRLAASAYRDGYGELPTDPRDYSDETRAIVDRLAQPPGDG